MVGKGRHHEGPPARVLGAQGGCLYAINGQGEIFFFIVDLPFPFHLSNYFIFPSYKQLVPSLPSSASLLLW